MFTGSFVLEFNIIGIMFKNTTVLVHTMNIVYICLSWGGTKGMRTKALNPLTNKILKWSVFKYKCTASFLYIKYFGSKGLQ